MRKLTLLFLAFVSFPLCALPYLDSTTVNWNHTTNTYNKDTAIGFSANWRYRGTDTLIFRTINAGICSVRTSGDASYFRCVSSGKQMTWTPFNGGTYQVGTFSTKPGADTIFFISQAPGDSTNRVEVTFVHWMQAINPVRNPIEKRILDHAPTASNGKRVNALGRTLQSAIRSFRIVKEHLVI